MEVLIETPVLKFNPNTLQEVRSLYNLDKPGRIEESVRSLEHWIQKQEHFISKKFDRNYLERIIVANKGLLERTKSKLDKLCTFRTLLPEYFGYYDVRDIINTPHYKDLYTQACMMNLTPENYRVYLLRVTNVDYLGHENKLAFIRFIFFITEYVTRHDYNSGFIIIIDLRDVNLIEIISKIDLTLLRHFYAVMLEGYGARVKGLHFITDSKLIENLVNFVKFVVYAKLAQRVYYHTNLQSLHKFVPKNILCAEYGGSELPLADLGNLWEETLTSHEHIEYMKTVRELRTDESKRLGDKISDEYLQGSFRTLVVD